MAELTWEGKYDKDRKRVAPTRIPLPFQTVETVNESGQIRARNLELWTQGQPTEWRNRLIWGDKKYVLPSLLPELAGKVNLIYIDPPFATGADFSFTTTIPESEESFTKEPSMIEQKAYRDTWGRGLDSYLQWFYDTSMQLKELLADTGSIYVHLDANVCHYAKAILDEIFGVDSFQNEIIWKRTHTHADARGYGSMHDTLLFYMLDPVESPWYTPYRPHSQEYLQSHYTQLDADGRRYQLITATAPGHGKTHPPMRFGDRLITPPAGRMWAWTQENIDRLWAEGRFVITSQGMPRYNGTLLKCVVG